MEHARTVFWFRSLGRKAQTTQNIAGKENAMHECRGSQGEVGVYARWVGRRERGEKSLHYICLHFSRHGSKSIHKLSAFSSGTTFAPSVHKEKQTRNILSQYFFFFYLFRFVHPDLLLWSLLLASNTWCILCLTFTKNFSWGKLDAAAELTETGLQSAVRRTGGIKNNQTLFQLAGLG